MVSIRVGSVNEAREAIGTRVSEQRFFDYKLTER